MSEGFRNRLQEYSTARGWSQDELARRAHLSRPAISAIEVNRVVPSTAAALTLATAFECRVEDLFSLGPATGRPTTPTWAWPANDEPRRFWRALVNERTLIYPVERTSVGALPSDGAAGTWAL